MKVYVVHTEWERLLADSNSQIVGVYTNPRTAQEVVKKETRHLMTQGYTPYLDPDTGDDYDDWDFDVHITEQEVQE